MMTSSPLPKSKHVTVSELAKDKVAGRARRMSRAQVLVQSVTKVSMLHKHLSRSITNFHLEQEGSSGDGLTMDVDTSKKNFMVFCPALEAWIRSTQGISLRDAFKAWAKWAKELSSQEKTVGGSEDPRVGMYVMPSSTAPQELMNDSSGSAGRITAVSHGNDGKVTVTVLWSQTGVEKGDYVIPNRWDFVMAMTSDRDVPKYPLLIAEQEDIDLAIQHEKERQYFDSMSDEHLQIFRTSGLMKFDPLSPSRMKALVERSTRSSSPRPDSPLYASPRGRASPGLSPSRHSSSSSSPRARIRSDRSPYASWGRSGSPGPSKLSSAMHQLGSVGKGDEPYVGFERRASQDFSTTSGDGKLNFHASQPNSIGRNLYSRVTSGGSEHRGSESEQVLQDMFWSELQEDDDDSYHSGSPVASMASRGRASPPPRAETASDQARKKVVSPLKHGLDQWRLNRTAAHHQANADENDDDEDGTARPHSAKLAGTGTRRFSSASSVSGGDAMMTFTGMFGEQWAAAGPSRVRDKLLDAFYTDTFVPRRPRVHYKETLPTERPKSAQHRTAKAETPMPNQLFCRGLSDTEIRLLPSAVLVGTKLFRSCVLVCAQDTAPMQRSTSFSPPLPLVQALEEQEITTVCAKDMWRPETVARLCRKLARAMRVLAAHPPLRKSTQAGDRNPHNDRFTSMAAWKARPQTNLCCLSLQRVLLQQEGSKLLVDAVLNHPDSKLETLYLLHNELQDEGVLEIVRALTHSYDPETERMSTPNRLQSISLIQNKIRNDGAAALASAVTGHPALTHLDLSKNEIASAGGAALAKMIRTSTVLSTLLLVDNQIQVAGSLSFTKALKAAPKTSAVTVVTGTAQNPRPHRRPALPGKPPMLSTITTAPETTHAETLDLSLLSPPRSPSTVASELRSPGLPAMPSPSLGAFPGSALQTLPANPAERGEGWRGQVEEGTLLWELCNGEQKRPTWLSHYGFANTDRKTLKSERDELVETYYDNERERVNAAESLREKTVGNIVKQYSVKSHEVTRADQVIKEMKKARQRLLAEMGQVEKEMRFGWEEKVDTLLAEAEWFTRDIARREAREALPEMDPYDKLLSLLFVKDSVVQPGDDVVCNPTPAFLESMSLVLADDADFTKRQEASSRPKTNTRAEKQPFPHPGWATGFHLEVDKCHPALHVKHKRFMKLLPDGSAGGGWKTAILSPPIARSPTVTRQLDPSSNDDARGSFVQIRVMGGQTPQRCYVMLGVARGGLTSISAQVLQGTAASSLPLAVMFALHNGRLYRNGKPAGALATRGATEADRVGMRVDEHGKTATVFYNADEVGKIDLEQHLGKAAGRHAGAGPAGGKKEKSLARSDSAGLSAHEEEGALHFVVDLGIDGQELEIVEARAKPATTSLRF